MKSSILLSAVSALTLVTAQTPSPPAAANGRLGSAAVVSDNPVGVTYVATLPDSRTSGIRGTVTARSGANGLGVEFTLDVSGFPNNALGPFSESTSDQP